MGDYVFGVHNAFGEAQLGLRKRRVDADTGLYHVPRAIRSFAHNGTHVIYDHEFRDAVCFLVILFLLMHLVRVHSCRTQRFYA